MAYSSVSHVDTNNFDLIWLADEINELKKKFPQSFAHLESLVSSVENFSDSDLFVNFLYETNSEKMVLIVTGALGKNTVPIIHDAAQLHSIFIFCHNKIHHEQWTKNWSKVNGVFNNIDAMCQAIEQLIKPKPPSVSRRSLTPSLTTRHDRVTTIDDQQNDRHSPLSNPDDEDTTSNNSSHHSSIKIERETQKLIKTKKEATISTDNQRKYSPIHTLEEHSRSPSPLINSLKQTKEHLSSNFDQLQQTLIETTQRQIRQSLFNNDDIHRTTSINVNTIDRLQDTLRQTIEKHVTTKKDDSNTLTKLFGELKQVLVDTLIQQQQPGLLQDMIKQTVIDALKQQQNATTTSTNMTNHRKSITIGTHREVKISANTKYTRIDGDFRQQRENVVKNKRLRDLVQQWTSIGSMDDLVTTIRTHGKDDLECAWLLFAWIAQNIHYLPNCNSNAAEKVFRTRQGVCRGFVSLYHECCSLLRIECAEISGYAKQAFIKSGEDLKQSPHAWNSIILNQFTYLVDPTWGAGGRENEKKLEDFYFLTSPEEFIYTHYCNGYQLLEPEITKLQFLSLPVMKSTYYQLGLTLLSPKQGFNQTNDNLFKIAIRTREDIQLFIQLKVDENEYPRSLHTLCQRDQIKSDVWNCFIAPPLDGLYEIAIFAKTNNEILYTDAIEMRLRVSNLNGAFTFPILYSIFTEQKCILIEPLHRLINQNEQILIQIRIPNANVIKIKNGDDYIVPCRDEYKKGLLKKEIRVNGDIHVCARWDDNADTISTICVFNMI